MNTLTLSCLLCLVVYRTLGAQGSEATFTTALAGVTGGPASGEGLPSSMSYDDGIYVDEDLSGGDSENFSLPEVHSNKDEKKKRKNNGKRKNRPRNKITTPFNPGHTYSTNGHTSTHPLSYSTTQDPCTSTHLGYCIHGYCQSIDGLREPVCICMKGYDGERCGIQTLGSTSPSDQNHTELVQTVLVIIAVVLSVISCLAILLMTCAHYRSHKNFLASYLGSASEQEKLQKPVANVMV